MSEKAKNIRSLAQKAAVDTKVFRALLNDPVATVKKKSPELSDEEAKTIATTVLNKAVESKPKSQDEKMFKVFQDTIHDAKIAYTTTVVLNVIVFAVGILLLLSSFGFEIAGRVTGNTTWQNVATTGIIGAIGIGTVISIFILRPLTAIQNSVGNLAQIEVAFLSFMDRRNIITDLDSQDINDANTISKALGTAASETIVLIDTYCEDHKKDKNDSADNKKNPPDKPEASQSQTPPAGAALPKAPS